MTAILLEVLITLTTHSDVHEEDYDPYDGVDGPFRPLPPEIHEKGLGPARSVPVLQVLCKELVLVLFEGSGRHVTIPGRIA